MPTAINGIRLPNRVFVRSESAPKNGNRKTASTLSIAISTPVTVSLMPNVFCSISGMMLSYVCQNAQIERNASPISIVRFVFSFIIIPLLQFPRRLRLP